MQSVFINQGGGADVLRTGDLPDATITGDDQVLVRIEAAGINPIDTKIRSAPDRFPVTFPAILGCDGAGVVADVGAGVTGFTAGDEVYFSQPGFLGRQGTYAELVAVDAALLAHKPRVLSFAEAAAAPLVLITAWEALYDRARIQAGQRVLVHAGAGGVGHVAVQLAKCCGAEVAATVSSDAKADYVRALGADKVINYRTENVIAAALDWTGGEGVDITFDTVGGAVLDSCFSCTRPYGDVVTILQPGADTPWGEARKRNLRFSMELMLSPVLMGLEDAKRHQADILRRCAGLFDEEKLKITVAARYPLARAGAAHEQLEREHPIGKVVLEIDQ
jgi:NADPH2:quinone reductase